MCGLNVRYYDTNSILSLDYVGNKNSGSITVGTNNILSFFLLLDLPIPSMASVLGNLSYYTYKYYQSDIVDTLTHTQNGKSVRWWCWVQSVGWLATANIIDGALPLLSP